MVVNNLISIGIGILMIAGHFLIEYAFTLEKPKIRFRLKQLLDHKNKLLIGGLLFVIIGMISFLLNVGRR